MSEEETEKLPAIPTVPTILSPRIPLPADGIHVNFCKDPSCANFLNPASPLFKPRGRGAKKVRTDDYTVMGTSTAPFIKCGACGECPPLKSNLGIKEELDRISEYLEPKIAVVSCPNENCPHYGIDILQHKSHYWSFGKTPAGTQRFRCKACGRTFSDGQAPASRQRLTHLNGRIFKDLVSKKPLKKIAESMSISMPTLYRKIDFIYDQCVAFAASRERNLPSLERKYMSISVDRQVYSVNWASREDRRNVTLYGVGSADRRSGYVFGMHLNYDPSKNPEEIEKDAMAAGDYQVKRPMRKYARFWLAGDYIEAAKTSAGATPVSKKDPIWIKSAAKYYDAGQRPDIEAPDGPDMFQMLPRYGMLVHAEYTLYAHFFFLKQQLAGVENIRFYLDQDSGIRAACLGAFAERILDKTCNAFYVTIKTDYTHEEMLAMVAKGVKEKKEFLFKNPEYTELLDIFVRRAMIKERLFDVVEIGKWRDLWMEYPFPDMSEPDKIVCYLSNIKKGFHDTDLEQLAIMYERATLHPIDRFFMQVRTSNSILDRSSRSSTRTGRIWQKYNAYNPGLVAKLLEIYRVYYNFVKKTPGKFAKKRKGEPKRKKGELEKLMRTPAMRLGLAKGPVSIDTILTYNGEGNKNGAPNGRP